eukprot:scaffold7622_cov130-Isochrysis_galbana.AAC.2
MGLVLGGSGARGSADAAGQQGLEKNPARFSHVARAHRWVAPLTNSRPPMAARCEALPSTHLSGIQ